MKPAAAKEKSATAIARARVTGLSRSYLQTRVRGQRLYEAAFILAIIELSRRLHQAYAQAYDKQAAGWLLPQKPIPSNAVTPTYTPEMAACDKKIAGIFGGQGAIGAANGFEPPGLASKYPGYRGDVVGANGQIYPGHLTYSAHIYGSGDATGTTDLYVPAGGRLTSGPSPTDAVVTFYYSHLGNQNNVTLAMFHVADFGMSGADGRVSIGSIGGPGGGEDPFYVHSHIEIYKGNVKLPALNARAGLRMNPASVFCK